MDRVRRLFACRSRSVRPEICYEANAHPPQRPDAVEDDNESVRTVIQGNSRRSLEELPLDLTAAWVFYKDPLNMPVALADTEVDYTMDTVDDTQDSILPRAEYIQNEQPQRAVPYDDGAFYRELAVFRRTHLVQSPMGVRIAAASSDSD